jgi:hypothetical protein
VRDDFPWVELSHFCGLACTLAGPEGAQASRGRTMDVEKSEAKRGGGAAQEPEFVNTGEAALIWEEGQKSIRA